MKNTRKLLAVFVILLGLYMVVQFGAGAINPPMISGVAFTLTGITLLLL